MLRECSIFKHRTRRVGARASRRPRGATLEIKRGASAFGKTPRKQPEIINTRSRNARYARSTERFFISARFIITDDVTPLGVARWRTENGPRNILSVPRYTALINHADGSESRRFFTFPLPFPALRETAGPGERERPRKSSHDFEQPGRRDGGRFRHASAASRWVQTQ